MSEKIRKLVMSSPPDSWTWQLTGGGKVLRHGAAKTQAEAETAADKALTELKKAAESKAKE